MGMSPSEFLLRELRRRRTRAGLTQDELGEKAHFSGKHISAVELGTRPPKPDFLVAVDKALETGELFINMWEDLIKGAEAPVWLREWIEIEREATLLRWYEPAYIPGLLQTEAYARATLHGVQLTPEAIEQRVTTRLDRQSILSGEHGPQLVCVIDEMVLRRPIRGLPKVMADQLDHLTMCAEQPRIQIHVVSSDAGVYPGLQGGFILATMPDGGVMAHLDHQVRAQVVTQADDLVTLQGLWETIRGDALPRKQSLDLIKETAKTWT